MVDSAPVPITINSTATTAVLIGLATRALTFLGGLLVAKGILTQEQATAAVDPTAQYIVGALVTTAGTAWGAWYAKHRQSKLVTLGNAVSNDIAVVQ